jgi:SAM-dependent methyltransferase
VCGTDGAGDTVSRLRLPAMQNYVHRTREHALAAAEGSLALAVCASPVCGFAWNAAFDPSRLVYDDSYDNAVPSAVMARYYDEIATYLGEKYRLERGYVVDIGCGDGRFLEALARVWPECRALGVDPALPGNDVLAEGRVHLLKGVFDESQLEAAPSLFLCRHVLEHIPDPVAFVRTLRAAIGDRHGVPFFAEVPDLSWIVEHEAFWDFCYEHCNYFGEASLRQVFARAGFTPVESRAAFGSQYRWIEGTAAGTVAPDGAAADARPEGGPSDTAWPERLRAYAVGEQGTIAAARKSLADWRAAGGAVAVWGMATKGIVFSLLVDPDSTLIDTAVDVNVNKQGAFVPTTGRRIEAPAALQGTRDRPLAVVVMNPNYLQEIRGACASLGLRPSFVDATGVPLA